MRTCPPIERDNLVLHSDHYIIHYLTAYLGAVIGGLGQRGLMIDAVELMPTSQLLGCSITFDPSRQHVAFRGPAGVAYQASWDEHRGWCCQFQEHSTTRRYLGEPLVPAPEVVVNFIAGCRTAQTLGTLGLARPIVYCHRTPRELADDLIRFTPTCTWTG